MDLLSRVLRHDLTPIVVLLAVVAFVLRRLPSVDVGHSAAFRRRRVLNWLPLGLTYAFLYMGRYNLTVSKNALGDLMTKAEFGDIFMWGAIVYGCAFVVNGPLTDRLGGRFAILLGASGAAVANALMGAVAFLVLTGRWSAPVSLATAFTVLYGINMYFQSFGAVAIVKVNAPWFHVRERGVFGGIFGILISLGIYFAFDVNGMILRATPIIDGATELRAVWWVFFAPAAMLVLFCLLDFVWVKNAPEDAGQRSFDTADASSGDDGPLLPVWEVARRMFQNPVILTIAAIEFCSGFLRNALMHWYKIFAKETGTTGFVFDNWGMVLCCAGILGGVFAGTISDVVFKSRRGPVAAILYAGMLLGGVLVLGTLTTPALGWVVAFMSLCIIGVHGMLSGTASMDFGGRKNVGVAVGLIDGFVYLGTALQSGVFGHILPKGAAAQSASNWTSWPVLMIPVSAVGLLLATRIWNARPQPKRAAVSATLREPLQKAG
jgi:OPA family glycerol-3-phosphate transporter-like MFS transporter